MTLALPPLTRTSRLPAAIFIAVFVAALYLLPMHIGLVEPTRLSPTALDRAIPFLDWTIWIYYSYAIFLVLPFAVCRDDGHAARALYGLMANSIVAGLIFFVWPTSTVTQQPAIGGLTGDLWTALLTVDRPVNCFPSLHVANACLCAFALLRERRVWRYVAPLWAFLIVISTLTTKQHLVIDLPAGAALAGLSAWLVRASGERAPARYPAILR
jgi:hypothetical protein